MAFTMTKDPTDLELLKGYLEGQSEAFDVFYERHSKGLFAYFLSRVHNRQDAEDLLQVTFTKTFKNVKRIIQIGHIRGYLYKIARSIILNYFRDNPAVKERNLDMISGLLIAKQGQSSVEDLELAYSMIGSLSDEQKETVILRYFCGLNFREIAEAMETNISTVEYRLHRSIKKIKENYGERFI